MKLKKLKHGEPRKRDSSIPSLENWQRPKLDLLKSENPILRASCRWATSGALGVDTRGRLAVIAALWFEPICVQENLLLCCVVEVYIKDVCHPCEVDEDVGHLHSNRLRRI